MEQHSIDASPPRLLASRIVAGVLSIYAAVYGFFLLILAGGAPMDAQGLPYMIGLFALALTPFIAFVQLQIVSSGEAGRTSRPLMMAFVMMAPAGFWLYIAFLDAPYVYRSAANFFATLFAAGVPGLLALWLVGAFGWLALRKARLAAR